MVMICPVCNRCHEYDNIECLRRQSLPDKGEALAEIDKLKKKIEEVVRKPTKFSYRDDWFNSRHGQESGYF